MKIKQKLGNLFDEPYNREEDIYVHCISADYWKLGKCIAKIFRDKFPFLNLSDEAKEEFKDQFSVGSCFILTHVMDENSSYIANLITKEKYWEKPTYDSLRKSLESLKKQINATNNIKRLLMPRIASGLDRLNWIKVLDIIIEVFKDVEDLDVVIYSLK